MWGFVCVAGIAKFDTREMSSLSVERCEGSSFLATLFEIPEDSYPALEQREAEFKLLPVVPEVRNAPLPSRRGRRRGEAGFALSGGGGSGGGGTQNLDNTPMDFAAILCTRGDDHSYRQQHCEALGKPESARESCPCVACLLSRHGVDSIWRDDVLPCRTYLRHCVLAAKGCVSPARCPQRVGTTNSPDVEYEGALSGSARRFMTTSWTTHSCRTDRPPSARTWPQTPPSWRNCPRPSYESATAAE